MTNAMWFGKHPPDGYEGPAWGARAIFDAEPDAFSFLPDRKSARGEQAELTSMYHWLDKIGIPALRDLMRSQHTLRTDIEDLWIARDGYLLCANPNASHGYLYMGCWLDVGG